MCESSPNLKLLSGSGYLSSQVATQYGCGTLSSPWRIIVSPGQTLHLSLLHFSCDTPDTALGYISDRETSRNITLHSNCTHHEQHVMSTRHTVDVQLLTAPSGTDQKKSQVFLLKYKGEFSCFDSVNTELKLRLQVFFEHIISYFDCSSYFILNKIYFVFNIFNAKR